VELLIVAALALALGLVLGALVGARRTMAMIRSGRNLRAVGAVARMSGEVPVRSSADVLAGRIRVLLGATTYELPVLARGPSRRWLESLDSRFASLATDLGAASDNPEVIMARLAAETDALYDLLLSYDQANVLPPRAEVDEVASDAQILHAVLEVWRAVHPLADTLSQAASTTSTKLFEQPSS